MATSLPTEARGTKRKGEDVDNEDIISPEAQKIKTFIRGGFHKVLAKLGYHREISKSDLRSDHEITNSCLADLAKSLPQKFPIAGPGRSLWKCHAQVAATYSPVMRGLIEKHKQIFVMEDWPAYAIDAMVDFFRHHKAYRIITPLDRHKLMYLDPTSDASVEAIPSDVCLAHVHLDIFKLAYDWNIKHLQEFAHNALVKALAGQPTLAQFKHMLVSTGIFTEKYCTPPASEDHLLNLVLMALGTYGAMVHDAWMREENRQEYVNLYIVAPYFAVYRDLATPGHSVHFAEWSKEVNAKRQKIEGSGSMQLS
ncbi:hypothetical protein J4E81_009943 [Alternaria sp. BMP 2799]|nr:hypothetical protein J4E81_009943 [Alternaria sp. BMP 2799]